MPVERRATGTYVTSLSQCPAVAARTTAAKSVHDLRPDEFSVTMAIGDSITAGCFAKGIQTNPLDTLDEWRGVSYAGGGDAGAVTIPNLIKHYNPALTGGAVGNHGIELCFGPLCPIGPVGWDPTVDQLNAAQSGALATNLLHMVKDYLVPQVKARNISASAFKYLNLQIGSNDLCQLCAESLVPTGADLFESSVRDALEYVRSNIPNTVVNVIGQIPVSQIYPLTLNQPYCSQLVPLPHENIECSCALLPGAVGNATRTLMDNLQAQFDARLLKIVKDYQTKAYPDFVAIWQPLPLPLAQFPIESLSNVDCFHPSAKTHERVAAAGWNRLTLDAAARGETFTWEDVPTVRCLEAGDRIQTKGALGL
ncbi:hypothetical protein EXIGLDRAFT_678820 [Exidia glandulosa HHB12029]|uniref:SGNH hydrolase n=1 Tax=Exidia glandulosa HHB12029 TaxID=1314781 RepID=A0A165F864_EXIGL|nr:hypothetical protein EXIGLDRAFT_678820 [Exidia glandulosa HHB12029]